MRQVLFSICAALAVFGCGGDDGDLPPLGELDSYYGSCEYYYGGYYGDCYDDVARDECRDRGGYFIRNGSCPSSSSNAYGSCTDYYGYCEENVSQSRCYDSFVPNGTCYSSSSSRGSSSSSSYYYYYSSSSVYDIGYYRTVTIGEQVWMAQNLNYDVSGSQCYTCNYSAGKLYDWATAMALPSSCNYNNCSSQVSAMHQGICPNGWHIPSNADWNILIDYVGGSSTAGTKLKATDSWVIDGEEGNGTDDYGFTALSIGYLICSGNCIILPGISGHWWSADEYEYDDYNAYHMSMHRSDEYASLSSGYEKGAHYFSVRCVKNGSGTQTVRSSSSAASVYISKGNNINNYKTVTIGEQTWMAENLDYNASGSKCYRNQDSYCTQYGRLYDWATAMALPSSCNSSLCASQVSAKHRGICPSGWHIPSYDEWNTLMDYVGGSSTAGRHLKSTEGWSDCGVPSSGRRYYCEDTYGFAGLPGGHGYDGTFYDAGKYAYWWSATELDASYAYYRNMDYNREDAYWGNYDKAYRWFSVRCVQD